MSRTKRLFALASIAFAGLLAGVLLGTGILPAMAGGVCPGGIGVYYTSNEEGDTLFEWHTERGKAQVIRYGYSSGAAVRKILVFKEADAGAEPEKPALEGEKPEIEISGVIWVADPEKRVAIINGAAVREGETFTTRTGRKYIVKEIKRSDEVVYEEVKEGEDQGEGD
jgi:hypothetical protein